MDTEDTWSNDFWHAEEMCPEEDLRSACVFAYWAEFQYEWHPVDLEGSERSCSIDHGTFFVFD